MNPIDTCFFLPAKRLVSSPPNKNLNVLIYLAALCLLWLSGTSVAIASTITFDDLDASAGDIILNSYAGYTWTNISAYTSTPGFPGYNNGIVSGPNAAYTAGDALGSPIISTITSATPFNFSSVDLGSGWYDGMSVTVDGLLNGTQEFTKTVTVDTEGAQLFSFNFTGINDLEFYSTVTSSTTDPYSCGPSGCSQVTLDNIGLTPAAVPSVPEPPSVILLATGMIVFAVCLWRRRFMRTQPI